MAEISNTKRANPSRQFIRTYFLGTEKRKMKLTFALRTAIAASFIAASLAGATRANAQKINGAGATFPAPIYQKWFFEYNKTHPGVTFNYASVGSGAGVAQYKAGTVDFGATDAPLSDTEQSSIPH